MESREDLENLTRNVIIMCVVYGRAKRRLAFCELNYEPEDRVHVQDVIALQVSSGHCCKSEKVKTMRLSRLRVKPERPLEPRKKDGIMFPHDCHENRKENRSFVIVEN